MLEPPWFTVTATTIEAEPSSQSLEFRPGQGGVWQIEQKRQAEAAEFSGCLGVGGFASVISAFLTERTTAEILARFHPGQCSVDFGGVLISFLSDLAFGLVSRVISPQQLLCVLAPL